jgi:hypothetical protein
VYYWFWRNYIRGRLNYRICSAEDFIAFVQGFPDVYIGDILLHRRDTCPVSGMEEPYVCKTRLLMKDICRRKNGIAADFERFYRGIAREKKEKYSPCRYTNEGRLGYIRYVTGMILNETGRLEKETEVLREIPVFDSDIKGVFSLEGMETVREVYAAYWLDGGKGLRETAESSLDTLRRLKSSVDTDGEKKAIDVYAVEIARILNGGTPSKKINTINQLVGSAGSP